MKKSINDKELVNKLCKFWLTKPRMFNPVNPEAFETLRPLLDTVKFEGHSILDVTEKAYVESIIENEESKFVSLCLVSGMSTFLVNIIDVPMCDVFTSDEEEKSFLDRIGKEVYDCGNDKLCYFLVDENDAEYFDRSITMVHVTAVTHKSIGVGDGLNVLQASSVYESVIQPVIGAVELPKGMWNNNSTYRVSKHSNNVMLHTAANVVGKITKNEIIVPAGLYHKDVYTALFGINSKIYLHYEINVETNNKECGGDLIDSFELGTLFCIPGDKHIKPGFYTYSTGDDKIPDTCYTSSYKK